MKYCLIVFLCVDEYYNIYKYDGMIIGFKRPRVVQYNIADGNGPPYSILLHCVRADRVFEDQCPQNYNVTI